jgi:aminoglycoside 2'-N-acetyltransferase I
MVEVSIAEPGELSTIQLASAETLVRSAFGAGFRTHDWLHAVAGVHVVLTEHRSLVAFAAVVPRILRHGGRVLDTGYVEAVAVRADQQGRGLGSAVMDHAEAIIRTRHQIGALNAVESAADFYAHRGWQPWTGRTMAVGPAGVIDAHDDADRIFVLDAAVDVPPLDAGTALTCDWRPGDLW